MGSGYIDVTFSDTGGSGLNTATITDGGQEFTLSGTATSGVAVNESPTLVSGTTYRYSFTGSFGSGAVSVNFTAGAFADNDDNPNLAANQGFTVLYDSTDLDDQISEAAFSLHRQHSNGLRH